MPEPAITSFRVPVAPGRRLAVDLAGQGPPVLLLHGIGGGRSQWAPLIRALAGRYSLIAWDARGYGDSDGPPVESFAEFASDLFALMDALGLGRAAAVGHSMGGRILLEACAVGDPKRFTGVVLSGAQARYLQHMTPAERAGYVEARRGLFDGDRVRADKVDAIVDGLLHPRAGAEARARMRDSLSALRRDGYLAALAASAAMDRSAVLPTLAMPVRVVAGDSDAVCPAEVTREIAAAIGQGPPVLLDRVGHMPVLEAPEQLADVVGVFLDGLPDTGDRPRRPAPAEAAP
jgi:pimeloyl-ACP methyl ester carboxylesterase